MLLVFFRLLLFISRWSTHAQCLHFIFLSSLLHQISFNISFRFHVVFIFSPLKLEVSWRFELWLDVWCVFYLHSSFLSFFLRSFMWFSIIMQSIYWIIIKCHSIAYCPRHLRSARKSNQYMQMNMKLVSATHLHIFEG